MGISYFNTTLGLSMVPDAIISVETLTDREAAVYLHGRFENVANPSHANTLDAVSRHLGVDVRAAKGGRIHLKPGDSCLVAEISGVPRETREFTYEEISNATFTFRLVVVGGAEPKTEAVEHGIACCCPLCGPPGRLSGV